MTKIGIDIKKALTRTMVATAFLLAAGGCNSRVFVEEIGPSQTEVEISVGGGTAEVDFSNDDWNVTGVMLNGILVSGFVRQNGKSTYMSFPRFDGMGEIELNDVKVLRDSKMHLKVTMGKNQSPYARILTVIVGNKVSKEELNFKQLYNSVHHATEH